MQPLIRAEGVAEPLGDVVLICTGGTAGQAVTTEVLITLNTGLTSKALQGGSEALLLVNDPNPPQQTVGSNVFQGEIVPGSGGSSTSVKFSGVTFTVANEQPTILRVTNLRGDASGVPLSSGGAPYFPIVANIAFSSSSVTLAAAEQMVALPVTGLNAGGTAPDGAGTGFSLLHQCIGWNTQLLDTPAWTGATPALNVSFTEGITSAFRPAGKLDENGKAVAQNMPGQLLFTESMFYNPDFAASSGLNVAGLATQGTRLMATFTNVPDGLSLYVTTSPSLTDGQSGYSTAARLIAANSDGTGAFNPVAPTTSVTAGGASFGIAPLAVSNHTATAVWEVVPGGPDLPGGYPESIYKIEKFSFGVVPAYRSGAPATGMITVAMALAPTTTDVAVVPRFAAARAQSFNVFSVQQCGAPTPDLIVSDAYVPSTAAAGEVISATTTVANPGSGDAGPFDVSFELQYWDSSSSLDVVADSQHCSISGLAAGQSANCTVKLTVPGLAASQTPFKVVVRADSGSAVPEDDEGNNTRTARLTVSGCQYNVPGAQIVGAAASTQSVRVSTASVCSWNAASEAAWLHVSTADQRGAQTLSYSVDANAGGTRTGDLVIAGQHVGVTQAAASCTYSLSATTKALPASASTGTVQVTTQDGCPWSATSAGGWLTVDSPYGNGSGTVTLSATANSGPERQTTVTIAGQTVTATQAAGTASTDGLRFVAVTPCRIADTRDPAGPFGAPAIGAGGTRDFNIPQSACGIPDTAKAYSLNVTVVPSKSLPYLTVWPAGQPKPWVSTLNSVDGRIKANAAVVRAGSNGAVSVYAEGATDVVLDINGYFIPASDAAALAFYPLAPCRIADTRNAAGSFGGPRIAAGRSRTFPILSSACQVPQTAQAYSLNVTAVPPAHLPFITVWPTGSTKPWVSTLNSPTGTIVANAAIVPAGTSGSIDVYAEGATDLVIDINGYFAPAAGVEALSLYTVTPCRVFDTREASGSPTLNRGRNFVIAGKCAVGSDAKAYSVNATVVPKQPLPFLTLWPAGRQQPLVSTLNAVDGSITANAAIVPTDDGSIGAYAEQPSELVLDVNGYFAP